MMKQYEGGGGHARRVGLNGTTILLSPGGTKFSLSPLQSSHKIVRDVAARARIALKLPERTW